MSAERYIVSEVNPNDSCGGGGCLCSETKVPEAEGPYIVFHAQEMASNISPHAVLCASCLNGIMAKDHEAVSAGEQDPEPIAEIPRVMKDTPVKDLPDV